MIGAAGNLTCLHGQKQCAVLSNAGYLQRRSRVGVRRPRRDRFNAPAAFLRETITWTLAQDPQAGKPLTESGLTRSFTIDGARSISLPTVTVLYSISRFELTIHDAKFEHAKFAQAGRA